MNTLLWLVVSAAILGVLGTGLLALSRASQKKKKSKDGADWEKLKERFGIPAFVALAFLGWWLLTKDSSTSSSWAFKQATAKWEFWVGLAFLVGAGKLLALPKPFAERFDRKLLLVGAITAGTLLLVWTLFSWPGEVWGEAQALTLGNDPYLPKAEKPRMTDSCEQVYTYEIPADSAQPPDSFVVEEPNQSWTVHWTGERPLDVLQQHRWPEGVNAVTVQVSYRSGHLDVDDSWDSATGEHLKDVVTRGRNYIPGDPHSFGYCPGKLRWYPVSDALAWYLGPGQTALVVNRKNPERGVYPFSDFGGELPPVRIEQEEHPVVLFNNWNPPGNGRLHAVELEITVEPAK